MDLRGSGYSEEKETSVGFERTLFLKLEADCERKWLFDQILL